MTVDARDLGRGIGVIRLPLPIPALKWTNAYVLETPAGLTLIDCGAATEEGWETLNAGLGVLGTSVDDLTTVIGTHLHPDHIGLAKRVVEAAGARFVMHDSAVRSVSEYNDWSIAEARVVAMAEAHGVPPDEIPAVTSLSPRPGWAGEAIPPTDPVTDGDAIDLGGGRTLAVVHTPGHEGAHICVVDSETGALFSGDHILPRITPVVMHREGQDLLGTYLDSLGRIERMDIGLTYPAHVTVLEDGSLRARQIALHHERRLGAMLQELRTGPANAWQIVGRIFRPHLAPLEQRLALSETVAHFEYLLRRNEVERDRRDGVWHYRLPSRRW